MLGTRQTSPSAAAKPGAKIEILDMQEEAAVEPAQRPVILPRQEHRRSADGRERRRRCSGRSPRSRSWASRSARDASASPSRFARVGRLRRVARCTLPFSSTMTAPSNAGRRRTSRARARSLHRALRQHAIRIEQQQIIGFEMPHGEIAAGGKTHIALPFEIVSRGSLPRAGPARRDPPADCRYPPATSRSTTGSARTASMACEQDRAGAITDHGDAHAALARGRLQMVERRRRAHDRPPPGAGKGRPARASERSSRGARLDFAALGDHARQADGRHP